VVLDFFVGIVMYHFVKGNKMAKNKPSKTKRNGNGSKIKK